MSEPYELQCPMCTAPLRVQADWGGKRVRCPECESVLRLSDNALGLTVQQQGQTAAPTTARLPDSPATAPGAYAPQGHPDFRATVAQQAPPRSSTKAPLLIVLVLLIAGGAAAAWYFFGDQITGANSAGDIVQDKRRYLPDDMRVANRVEVKRLLNDPTFKRDGQGIRQYREMLTKEFQVDPDTIERVLGASTGDRAGLIADEVALVSIALLDTDVSADAFPRDKSLKSKTVGDYTVYEVGGGEAVCRANATTILAGDAKLVAKVLTRDSDASPSPQMTAIMDRSSKDAITSLTLNVEALRGGNSPALKLIDVFQESKQDITGVIIDVFAPAGGATLRREWRLLMRDNSAASDLAQEMNNYFQEVIRQYGPYVNQLNQAQRAELDQARQSKVSADGNELVWTGQLDAEEFLKSMAEND